MQTEGLVVKERDISRSELLQKVIAGRLTLRQITQASGSARGGEEGKAGAAAHSLDRLTSGR